MKKITAPYFMFFWAASTTRLYLCVKCIKGAIVTKQHDDDAVVVVAASTANVIAVYGPVCRGSGMDGRRARMVAKKPLRSDGVINTSSESSRDIRSTLRRDRPNLHGSGLLVHIAT